MWSKARKLAPLGFLAGATILSYLAFAFALAPSEIQGNPAPTTIRGTVSDGVLPIVGARVRIQGDTRFVITDKNGYFVLPIEDDAFERVPITAGKEGWFNNGLLVTPGAQNVEIILQHIPLLDDPGYPFVSPEPRGMGAMMGSPGGGMMDQMMGSGGMMGMASVTNCGNCHRTIYERWKESKMAATSQNPWVLDLYNGTDATGQTGIAPGYKLDYPESQGGTCADCHAPAAAVNSPGRTDLNEVLRRGGVEAMGVSCDFCHKIQEVEVSNKPGVQAVRLNRQSPAGGIMMRPVFAFGPYHDVVTRRMAATYSSLYEKSEYCSSCHQDGRRLPEGQRWDYLSVYPEGKQFELYEVGRIVPSNWTYQEWLEWQQSLPDGHPDKGRQCQNCHMNWTQDMLPYDRYIVTGMARRMWGVRRDPSEIHPHRFDGATRERLENSAYLWVESEETEDGIRVTVEVTNTNAGHRIPTGISIRNIILLVDARDATGDTLKLRSGPRVPEWGGRGSPSLGNYAGLPGKGFAKVTADAQGNLTVPYWQAVKIVSDNRIKPKEPDSSNYVFETPKPGETVEISARLVYRKAFKPLADRKKWQQIDILMEEKTGTLDVE